MTSGAHAPEPPEHGFASDNAAGMQHCYQQTAARALLTGNVITSVQASNGSASAAGTLYVLCGQDATP